jgi:hypothetical protein
VLEIKGVGCGEVVFSENPPREDRISRARRHVTEGEHRTAVQSRLVAKVARQGHSQLAIEGQVLLDALETSLALARTDLARVQSELEGIPPG